MEPTDNIADNEYGANLAHMQQRIAELEQQLAQHTAKLYCFQTLMDSLSDSITMTDRDGHIIYANQACQDITGYDNTLLGMPLDNLYAEESTSLARLVEHVLSSGFWDGVLNKKRHDGRTLKARVSAAVIHDGTGQVQALSWISRDSNELTGARASYQASEERLRLALQGTATGIWEWDVPGDLVHLDAQWMSMFGYANNELACTTQSWQAVVHSDDLPAITSAVQQHLQGHTPFCESEHRLRTKNGQWRWVQMRGKVVSRDAHGQPLHVTGTLSDVHPRKQAELELRTFYTLAENAPDAIIVSGMQGSIFYSNASSNRLFGLTSAVGLDVADIAAPGEIERLPEIHQHIYEHGLWRGQFTYQRTDGSIVPTQVSAFLIYDSGGKPYAMSAIVRDVTEYKRTEAALQTALRESQSLLQEIIDHSPAVIFVKDCERRILLMNEYCASLLNLDRKQIIGLREDDITPQGVIEAWRPHDDEVFATCEPAFYEEYFPLSDGMHIYLSTKFPLYDAQGQVYAVGGISTDITQRKLSENALRTSEQRFRAIFEHAGIGIALATIGGEILQSNATLQRLLGYSSEELQGIPYVQLTHPDDREMEAQLFRQMMAQNSDSYRIEKRYLRKDGSIIWCRLTVSLVKDNASLPHLGIAMLEDISEYKRAAEALNTAYKDLASVNDHLSRSRDLLRTLFDGLDDGLLLLDNDGRVMIANQSVAALLGVPLPRLIGHSWLVLCSTFKPAFPGNLAINTLHDGRPRRRRERMTSSTGQVRILDMQTLPLLNSGQSTDQVVLHIVDMTDRLQLETLVIENERFAASGRLAATVAHEVNTPLQAIRNFLYLAGKASTERRDTYLSLVREEIDRISNIVRQLLDLYRVDNTTIALVDMNMLIDRVALLTGGTLIKNKITLERHLKADLPHFWGRADQLTQVLLNLIMNAIDAMPGGGKLLLSTSVSGQTIPAHEQSDRYDTQPLEAAPRLLIEITDTGIGMRPAVQARIFDPFFTTRANGTGLGLAISQKIVAQHDGNIFVRSTPGSGSTFTILLPIRSEEMAQKDDDTEE